MPEREKVIEGLQKIIADDWIWKHADYYARLISDAVELLEKQEAAYQGAEELLRQKTILFDDAIKRLKEQEAKQVIGIADFTEGIEVGYCPSCGRGIVNKKINETKYCKFCGQAVLWDD